MRWQLLGLLGVLVAGTALAHHSTANFDRTKETTITGTVTYFGFTNPHSFIDIDAAGAAPPASAASAPAVPGNAATVGAAQGGAAEPYKVFAPGRVLLVRYDWLPTDVKPGDKVTVTGYPDRKNPHFMYLARITFASGKVWTRSAQIPE